MFPVDLTTMERQAEKLANYLLAMNLSGILTATAFYLIHGLLAGIAGFMAGFFISALLIRKKNAKNNCSAGVLEELAVESR